MRTYFRFLRHFLTVDHETLFRGIWTAEREGGRGFTQPALQKSSQRDLKRHAPEPAIRDNLLTEHILPPSKKKGHAKSRMRHLKPAGGQNPGPIRSRISVSTGPARGGVPTPPSGPARIRHRGPPLTQQEGWVPLGSWEGSLPPHYGTAGAGPTMSSRRRHIPEPAVRSPKPEGYPLLLVWQG